jgi:hypothetical protein
MPFLAADARKLLIGLEFGARLVVIEDKRPEILGRDIRRKMNLVGLRCGLAFSCALAPRTEDKRRMEYRGKQYSVVQGLDTMWKWSVPALVGQTKSGKAENHAAGVKAAQQAIDKALIRRPE